MRGSLHELCWQMTFVLSALHAHTGMDKIDSGAHMRRLVPDLRDLDDCDRQAILFAFFASFLAKAGLIIVLLFFAFLRSGWDKVVACSFVGTHEDSTDLTELHLK